MSFACEARKAAASSTFTVEIPKERCSNALRPHHARERDEKGLLLAQPDASCVSLSIASPFEQCHYPSQAAGKSGKTSHDIEPWRLSISFSSRVWRAMGTLIG